MNPGNHVGIAMLIAGSLLLTSGSVLLIISLAKKSLTLLSHPRSASSFLLLIGMTFICIGMYSNRQYQSQRKLVIQAIEEIAPLKFNNLLINNKQLAHANYSDLGNGEPLLHRVIRTGCYALLLPLFHEHVDLERRNVSGDTALLLALREQELIMVSQLLNYGADAKVRDTNGVSASELAQQMGAELTELLHRFKTANAHNATHVKRLPNPQLPNPVQ
ncbi:MAG: ankyrin repeat domain-containing protein [Phycisphaeraceae bacterium]|nr:ankyrin repeat domain-containing protein [Phycisphaeraceae bacterium]